MYTNTNLKSIFDLRKWLVFVLTLFILSSSFVPLLSNLEDDSILELVENTEDSDSSDQEDKKEDILDDELKFVHHLFVKDTQILSLNSLYFNFQNINIYKPLLDTLVPPPKRV